MKAQKFMLVSALSFFSLVCGISTASAKDVSAWLPKKFQAIEPSFAKDATGSVLYMSLQDASAYCTRQGGRLPDIRELAIMQYPAQGIRATSVSGLTVDPDEMDVDSSNESRQKAIQSFTAEMQRNEKDGFACQTMYDKQQDHEFCGFFYDQKAYAAPKGQGLPTTPQQPRYGTDQAVDDNTFAWSSSVYDGEEGMNFVLSLYSGAILLSANGQYNMGIYHGAVRCVK